ncbi:glycosyltransferase [Limosilactobacillus pontis]|uniref:glycosyltransferase n=1 Tax=Limosilactobacillus pontis TaxID=35787 RepID=UPI002F26A760
MKVLMINTNYLEDNGVSTFIIGNSKLLARKGVAISVVAPNIVSENIKNDLKSSNVKLYELPMRFSNSLLYFYKLYNLVKKNNYDIVHVNGSSGSMLLEVFASYLAGVKVRIAHCHNTKTSHPFLNDCMNPLLELLVTNRFACNYAAGKWLYGKRKFWVIKNGLVLNDYKYQNESGSKSDKVILGNVGRFNFQKNQEFLIDLINQLDSKYVLLLVGSGDNFNSLRKMVREKGLRDRVIFTGTVDNVQDYLRKMDLFLFPSRYEGQPYSVIEALASGLPILISDRVSKEVSLAGKLKFIQIDNVNDWVEVVNNFDYENSRINRYKNSLSNIKALKSKGYDLNTNVNDMLELYNSFVKDK